MILPNDAASSDEPMKTIHLDGPVYEAEPDYSPIDSVHAVFSAESLPLGLCLGSKSGYRELYPRNQFVPNANVFCQRHGKIWWGDLDLRIHGEQLRRVARRLGYRLYVLTEFAGRYDNAQTPFAETKLIALWHTRGLTRIAWRSALRGSGLTINELSRLYGILPSQFDVPVEAPLAIQWDCRLENLVRISRELALRYDLARWGEWWLLPNKNFGGTAPLQAVADVRAQNGTLTVADTDEGRTIKTRIGWPFFELRPEYPWMWTEQLYLPLPD